MKNWDKFYGDYGRFYLEPSPNLNECITFLQKYKITEVFDLGCGSGRNAVHLAKQGYKVTAFDFSETALDHAREWADLENVHVTFSNQNVTKLPPDLFADKSYGVIASDIFQFLDFDYVRDIIHMMRESNGDILLWAEVTRRHIVTPKYANITTFIHQLDKLLLENFKLHFGVNKSNSSVSHENTENVLYTFIGDNFDF